MAGGRGDRRTTTTVALAPPGLCGGFVASLAGHTEVARSVFPASTSVAARRGGPGALLDAQGGLRGWVELGAPVTDSALTELSLIETVCVSSVRRGDSRRAGRKGWSASAGQVSTRGRAQPRSGPSLVQFESQSYCGGNCSGVTPVTFALRGKPDTLSRVDLIFLALCRRGGRAHHSGGAAPLAAAAAACRGAASTAPHSAEP